MPDSTNAYLAGSLELSDGNDTGTKIGQSATDKLGFLDKDPISRPTVSGSAGANAALISLLTALENLGLIVDSSS